MKSKLNFLLTAGLIAATSGCGALEDITRDHQVERSDVAEVRAATPDTVYVEDVSHYSKWVGRKMRTYNGLTGLTGNLEFNRGYEDEIVVTKKRYWQNEVRGKTVPVYSEANFYASPNEPRKLRRFNTATIFDKDWCITYIELDRETAGKSDVFKIAEGVYLNCLDALENPTINGRARVASIVDGGI